MARFARRLLTCLSLVVPLAVVPFVGCSDTEDDDTGAGGHGQLTGYEDVAYEGDTTDEALVSLVAALEQGTTNDPGKAATLDAPLEAVPAATAPTFTWHVGPESRRTAPRDGRLAAVPPPRPWPEPLLLQHGGCASAEDDTAPRAATVLELTLRAALSGVPSAHAHGDPFNGYGTFVTVASEDNPKLARVFTGDSSWKPSAAVWKSIVDAGGTLTVTLVGAEFEENRIPQGSGPYAGSTTTFTVTP